MEEYNGEDASRWLFEIPEGETSSRARKLMDTFRYVNDFRKTLKVALRILAGAGIALGGWTAQTSDIAQKLLGG